MSFEAAFKKLNTSQKEAVTSTEGFVRVIAGAGSGKTRALTMRYAYLVTQLGILPENMLCVTFTNKAASEMRARIHRLTGDNDTGYINTFHGFCVGVLQEDSHAVKYPKRFLVLDNEDIDAMLAVIYEERGLTLHDMTYGQARDMIEIRKIFKEPEYYKDMIRMSPENLLEKYRTATKPADMIFYGYLYQEKKCFGLDYNDLIKFTLYIFKENEDIKLKWQKRLEYIMVDEFQDIDDLQDELMEVLSGYHKNLFVVGDPDQTIYSWRGANGRWLQDFDVHHPGTKTIMMMQNYRSTPEILRAANALIDKNKDRIKKELIPVLPSGALVRATFLKDAKTCAKEVASEIARLHEAGEAYSSISILYRAHYVTQPIEEALIEQSIPYAIYSGLPFFSRREIKDALCYLRFLALEDDLSLRRIINVPKRNIGKRRLAFIEEYADRHKTSLYEAMLSCLDTPELKSTGAKGFVRMIDELRESMKGHSVSEILRGVLDRSGYERMLRTEGSQERLDNLAELRQSIYEYEMSSGEETTLEAYLAHAALFTNMDASLGKDEVKLMTVHTAKGLEFPTVFLCGMNEGIFPSRKTRTIEAMQEERRLAFVAVTRAQKRLYLWGYEGVNFDGSLRYPSRFLLDMDDNVSFSPELPDDLREGTVSYVKLQDERIKLGNEPPRFMAGTRIRHMILGDGTIDEVLDGAYLISFDEMDTPRKISFRVKIEAITTAK